jgi:hypothetical protein
LANAFTLLTFKFEIVKEFIKSSYYVLIKLVFNASYA